MAVQHIQQQRAAYALQQVQDYATHLSKDECKKFKSRASELPFMIHANGLGQALAFFKSKGDKDGYNFLYQILADWLVQEDRPFADYTEALNGVTGCDRATYLSAQAESILLMNWVKQFAAAFMEV